MRVVFTEEALKNLDDIYEYYQEVAPHVAYKIIEAIIERTNQLVNFSDSGPEEPYLNHLGLGHRHLIDGNYKIVFTRDSNTVSVTHVFDARQNPDKLK
jgi:plasmid stabilization system protein ParE